jgi:hypothetical protein
VQEADPAPQRDVPAGLRDLQALSISTDMSQVLEVIVTRVQRSKALAESGIGVEIEIAIVIETGRRIERAGVLETMKSREERVAQEVVEGIEAETVIGEQEVEVVVLGVRETREENEVEVVTGIGIGGAIGAEVEIVTVTVTVTVIVIVIVIVIVTAIGTGSGAEVVGAEEIHGENETYGFGRFVSTRVIGVWRDGDGFLGIFDTHSFPSTKYLPNSNKRRTFCSSPSSPKTSKLIYNLYYLALSNEHHPDSTGKGGWTDHLAYR